MTQRALADHVAIALDPELRDAADSAAVCDLDDLTTARHVDAELTNSKGADHLPGLDPEAVNVQDVAIARRHFGPPIALRMLIQERGFVPSQRIAGEQCRPYMRGTPIQQQ